MNTENGEKKYDNIQMTYLNSYIDSITEELPEKLIISFNNIFDYDISEEINDIINKYLIGDSSINDENAIPKKVENEDFANLRKRRKYNIEKIKKSFYMDYKMTVNGEKVKDVSSPFNPIIMKSIALSSHKNINEVIDDIKERFDEWHHSIINAKISVNDISLENFVGFCHYEYFYIIEDQQPEEAKKLIRMDLEECIFNLSKTDKYQNYINFVPLRKTGLFQLKKARTAINSKGQESLIYLPDGPYLSTLLLDEVDFNIINHFTKKGIINSSETMKLETEGLLAELLTVLYPRRRKGTFSRKDYYNLTARLERLKNIRFEKIEILNSKSYRKLGKSITLFDEFYIPTEEIIKNEEEEKTSKRGSEYLYKVVLGQTITKAVFSSSLLPILSEPLRKLESGGDESSVARLIYMNISQDRIEDIAKFKKNTHFYSLIELQLIVKMSITKKARIEILKKAFEKLIEEGIQISKSEFINDKNRGDGFLITWVPFTENEKRDIKLIGSSEEHLTLNMNI